MISNYSFIPEIEYIKKLQLKKTYYSKFLNRNFTVLGIDLEKKELKIGIEGVQKKVDFFSFNNQYLSNEIAEN